jgi:hypothetical protein
MNCPRGRGTGLPAPPITALKENFRPCSSGDATRVPRTCRGAWGPALPVSSIAQIQRKIAVAPSKNSNRKAKEQPSQWVRRQFPGSRNNENGIPHQRNLHGPQGPITTEWRSQLPPTRRQRIQSIANPPRCFGQRPDNAEKRRCCAPRKPGFRRRAKGPASSRKRVSRLPQKIRRRSV